MRSSNGRRDTSNPRTLGTTFGDLIWRGRTDAVKLKLDGLGATGSKEKE